MTNNKTEATFHPGNEPTKAVQGWADDFMFPAERSNAKEGPVAYLIQGTPDPLGSIAVAAKAYMGEFFASKADITDEDRRYYLAEILKTKLKMPMEAVQLHWRIKGVTRSFTHQMVRQRTAAYSQESMRFAVKEDASDAVALPPSLQRFNDSMPGSETVTYGDWLWKKWRPEGDRYSYYPGDRMERQYIVWRETVETIGRNYMQLVNDGMPAEEARGLLAHNSVTQLNYITNLRNYQDHAGNRLCTQAQFEWRMVWVKMLEAMRNYCTNQMCQDHGGDHDSGWHCDNWQWIEIANIFRPVCYQTGQCEFKAGFDRKCKIRGRVDANADINRPSSEWGQSAGENTDSLQQGAQVLRAGDEQGQPVFIGAISPAEWLMDDGAAR